MWLRHVSAFPTAGMPLLLSPRQTIFLLAYKHAANIAFFARVTQKG